MTFTYVLTADIGKVRLEIGDTVSGQGVRASGANLTDEEIQVWLDREGSVGKAAAAACEMLARDWARAASFSIGPRSEQLSDVSKQYADQAKALRNQYGGGDTTFSTNFDREDGYSKYHDDSENVEDDD